MPENGPEDGVGVLFTLCTRTHGFCIGIVVHGQPRNPRSGRFRINRVQPPDARWRSMQPPGPSYSEQPPSHTATAGHRTCSRSLGVYSIRLYRNPTPRRGGADIRRDLYMNVSTDRAPLRGQLSVAGIVIGCIGCVIITASSVYTALKMGSLPWPTIFTSVTALVLLRALGHTSLNEANVTQVIMSAGSMVAGGLAFTIPGIWMLGLADETSIWELLFVALAGTLLGLACTALIRRHFVDDSDLEYPIGKAAAETLRAGRTGSGTGKRLFGSMGIAGVWTVLRDAVGAIPTMLASIEIPGISFGIYNSPMSMATGFLVGMRTVAFWFAGALIGSFGIVVGGSAIGLWSVDTASGIASSLGMGLMMGSGIAVVLKDVIPQIARSVRGHWSKAGMADSAGSVTAAVDSTGTGSADMAGTARSPNPSASVPTPSSSQASTWRTDIRGGKDAGFLALLAAVAALVICSGLGLGPLVAVVVVLLSFVTTVMSAQSVGQTGIDPMEIFGLIVLLLVAAISDTSDVGLFFVAGIIAVACGLAGDVMSDFKTGSLIGTDPRPLWVGQAIGALLGAVVSVVTLYSLYAAYGPSAFGTDQLFISAQASVVATMVSGIPSVPAFWTGLVMGIVLYFFGLPSMMLGLGVYLPFYMSLTAFIGALAKVIYDHIQKARGTDPEASEESGVVVASGLLGGESIVGVAIAIISVVAGIAG